MSKLAELGTLSCEQSAEETVWRIDWHESVNATISFISVPPLRPLRGLAYSLAVHICVIFAAGYFQWWSFLLPQPRHVTEPEAAALQYDPIYFNRLPALGAQSGSQPGSAAGRKVSPDKPRERAEKDAAEQVRQGTPPKTKAVYAGPQEIISNPPDAINVVQTIRRPDLVTPPKLKFPIRVQSMVMLPPPGAMPLLHAPAPKRPATAAVVEVKSKPIFKKPLLPIPPSGQSATMVAQQLASAAPPTPQLAPAPARSEKPNTSLVDSNSTNEKALIVLNAVTVPPDAPTTIPNGEISGSFAVIASVPARTAEDGLGVSNSPRGSQGVGSNPDAVPGTSLTTGGGSNGAKDGGKATSGQGASGKGSGGEGGVSHDVGNGGAGSGTGTVAGLGTGKSGRNGFPGITIIGGATNSGLHVPATVPRRRPTYGLTIISGGSSAGATSDLGVFGRDETVYTVYIPMADAGGGSDWPMQYALAGSVSSGNGLLSPPLAIKKVAAVSAVDPPLPRSGRVFISAIISETGDLHDLRPVRTEGSGSQIAIDALRQWQFAPAEINGKPVATKVLIGVAITNPPTNSLSK